MKLLQLVFSVLIPVYIFSLEEDFTDLSEENTKEVTELHLSSLLQQPQTGYDMQISLSPIKPSSLKNHGWLLDYQPFKKI